jgi:hypothetical protein
VIAIVKMFPEIYNIKKLFINPNLLIMKNLELNSEFNLLGQIDLNSVKVALDRDEMEEIVGGYISSRTWCLVGAGLATAACLGTFNPLGVASCAAWALAC